MQQSKHIYKILLITILLGLQFLYASAQVYKEPTGPVYDKLVKAFSASFLTGDAEPVKEAVTQAEKVYPGSPYVLFFKAFYHQASGTDVPGAMREYSEVIRMAPAFSDPYRYRAGLFSDKGLFDRAVSDMDAAIKIQGNAAPAFFYKERGDYKIYASDLAGGYADFKKASTIDPGDEKYYRGMKRVALDMKNAALVSADFDQLLTGNNKNAAVIRSVYAELYMAQQNWKEADGQMTLAFANKSFEPSANNYNNASIIAYKLLDYSRAVLYADNAIALEPRNADYLLLKAELEMDQKHWEVVYDLASRAIELRPDFSRANMIMAVAVKLTNRGAALAAQYEAKANRLAAEGK